MSMPPVSQPSAPQEPISQEGRANSWAKPVGRLKVTDLPSGAINLNVEGRQLTGPLRGFGQLWQKTYRVRLSGSAATPAEVIHTWKENFQAFWPKGNRFFSPLNGIAPGNVAVLNLAGPGGVTAPGGGPLISTGVMVIYADEESFTFMTPEGHMFAGIITFSAYEEEDTTVAQAQALVRANDPIYEMSFRLGFGHKAEDEFWAQTLRTLATHFGVQGTTQQTVVCLDARVQWAQAGNIWKNAAIRTGGYLALAPVRWFQSIFKRNSKA